MRIRFSVVFLLSLILAASRVNVTHAATTTGFQWTEHGDYTCNTPDCSSFSEDGVAQGTFGTMKYTDVGFVTDGPDANGCFSQVITYTFTSQNPKGDSLVLYTPQNFFCPTADPNVFSVTATFIVIGGTGQFTGATGQGTISIVFRGHPQNAVGLFSGTVTY